MRKLTAAEAGNATVASKFGACRVDRTVVEEEEEVLEDGDGLAIII